VIVYAVVDADLSPESPLGDSLEVFIRRKDAERSSRRCAATIRTELAHRRDQRARCGFLRRSRDYGVRDA
jgi:hypothetical protein